MHSFPGRAANTEVVQGTGDFSNHIACIVTGETDCVFEHATALDTAVDVLDADPSSRQFPVYGLLFVRQCAAARFLERCGTCHALQHEGEKAKILQQFTAFGERIGRCVGNPFVVRTPFIRIREKQNGERRIDQEYVLQGMALFLAALAAFLFICIFGALDTPFGSVMAKRGDTVDWFAAVRPNRSASAASERVGASPSARRPMHSTGNNRWIH